MALPQITNNSPVAGSIAWTATGIVYAGTNYAIGAGSSNKKFVWWEYGNGAPVLRDGDTLPELGVDDVLLFLNKSGIGALVPTMDLLDGSLLVSGSVLAGAVAADQIQTYHLTSNAVTTDKLAANSVTSNEIVSGAVTAEKLSIGSVGDSKVLNGSFEDGVAGWYVQENSAGSGSADVVTGVASSGRNALRISRTANATSSWTAVETDIRYRIPVTSVAGRKWYVGARVGSGTTASVEFRVQWWKADGSASATPMTSVASITATSNWVLLENQVTPPVDARLMSIRIYNKTQAATVYVDEVTAREVVVAAHIGDGQITTPKLVANAVTAEKLESELVLATKIVAGDPGATHAEMSPLGFKVFATDVGGGPPTEVVRLGVAASDDYFAVTKADGTLAATISQDGKVSADQVNANTSLYYRGEELQDLLNVGPRGVIAYGDWEGAASPIDSSVGFGLFDVGFEALPGRAYKISGNVRAYFTGGDGQLTLKLSKAEGGATPRLDVNALPNTGATAKVSHWNRYPFEHYIHLVPRDGSPTYTRILIGVGREIGPGTITANEAQMTIEDVGRSVSPTRTINGGGGKLGTGTPPVAPPATRTYVKQYGAINSMNYQGNNAQYNFDTGRMYQGLSPSGYGNLKSIATFNSMTADLSGSTINYIKVIFGFQHWYYNSGGTARIGVHGHTSVPGTFSGNGVAAISSNWPKPGSRWVDLPPGMYAGFKSGAHKGVYLEGDGTLETYGYASRPIIEISYTK